MIRKRYEIGRNWKMQGNCSRHFRAAMGTLESPHHRPSVRGAMLSAGLRRGKCGKVEEIQVDERRVMF
jgi:hypothetical protein